MKKECSIFLLLIIIFKFSFSQEELKLSGVYKGKNLYIQNPFSEKGGFCINEVKLNGEIINDEINSSAFEMDLSLFDFNYGDQLKIEINHKSDCVPTIINEDDIIEKKIFYIKNLKLDSKNEILKWKAKGNVNNSEFIIEQRRWKKWVEINKVKSEISEDFKQYSAKVYLHNGKNLFRIKQIDKFTKEIEYSKKIRYESDKKEVNLLLTKVETSVLFSDKTFYQIFDEYGNEVLKGYGNKAEMLVMKKGKYFVNYDTKMTEIEKTGKLRK